jgi:lactate permease
MPTPWPQNYDPLNHLALSSAVAAVPVVVLLGAIGLFRVRVHIAALLALVSALLIAGLVYQMPWRLGMAAGVYGAGFGIFPIGWIILNVIFFYELTVQKGLLTALRENLARVAPDSRVQLILIAFSFGAFIEGVAGFGTPVAITGAILLQLGFKPLHASGLALIANTAPVAFGSLGIPITTLAQVSGLNALKLSAMVGRQLPLFSLMIPFWVVGAFCGWRRMWQVWPAALVAGVSFAIPQFLISNYHGPWLVDSIAGACSILSVLTLLKFWKPPVEESTASPIQPPALPDSLGAPPTRVSPLQAWMPWIILTVFILVWGTPEFKKSINRVFAPKFEMAQLHNRVQRVPPVALKNAPPEQAIYNLDLLSATGTAILAAGILNGLLIGFSLRQMAGVWLRTIWKVRFSIMTIAAMLALGNLTKYSGTDATLGLLLAHSGRWYPFFGTMLGWLGVALTGSDTASNVIFGGLQRITAQQLGISPILMGAANSSGGVMGKMIDAQSIVVASTATGSYGNEGAILRFVLLHSIILAVMVAILVFLQATIPPFTYLVIPR